MIEKSASKRLSLTTLTQVRQVLRVFNLSGTFIFYNILIFEKLLLRVFCIGSNEVSAQNTDSIRAEAYVSETRPFVHQSIIFTVRVYHGSGVSKLDCEIMLGPEFSMQQLAGPPNTTRWLARGRQTSDFIYALTPIAEGLKKIQAAHIKATTDNIPHSGCGRAPTTQHSSWRPAHGLFNSM